jgi:hypothetical protein
LFGIAFSTDRDALSQLDLALFLQRMFEAETVSLQQLLLCGQSLSPECVGIILGSEWPPSLTVLDLTDCQLGSAHVKLLAHLFARVKWLSLSQVRHAHTYTHTLTHMQPMASMSIW